MLNKKGYFLHKVLYTQSLFIKNLKFVASKKI